MPWDFYYDNMEYFIGVIKGFLVPRYAWVLEMFPGCQTACPRSLGEFPRSLGEFHSASECFLGDRKRLQCSKEIIFFLLTKFCR